MTLRSFEFKNPMYVLEHKQEQEANEQKRSGREHCDGCQSKAKVWGVEYCVDDHAKAGRANMVRCKHYKGAINV